MLECWPQIKNILLPFWLPAPIFPTHCFHIATPIVFPRYWDLQSLDPMAFLLSFASNKFYLFTLLKFQVNHLIIPLYKPSTLLPPYIAFSYSFSTATTLVKFSSLSIFAPKQLNCGCRNTSHWSLLQVVFTAAVILKFPSQFTLPLSYVTPSCPLENEAIIREFPLPPPLPPPPM